jgi:hypothetical protein
MNMLRVFKVTSPMSVGSWILTGAGSTIAIAAASHLTGRQRRAGRAAGACAALLGPPLASYTGALLADTAVPVWHEARYELPFLFAASAAATAGAAATIGTPAESAGPARALAAGGGMAALAVTELMEMRLGDLAKGSLAAGAAVVAGGGRGNRTAALAGGAALLAGSLLERWAVFRAGFQSAADPSYTVGPQRSRRDREATD